MAFMDLVKILADKETDKVLGVYTWVEIDDEMAYMYTW